MLNGDVARYRTEELLRTAEARRAGRAAVEHRRAGRRAAVRRLVAATAAMLPVPIRH